MNKHRLYFEAEDILDIPDLYHPGKPQPLDQEDEEQKRDRKLSRALRVSRKRGSGPTASQNTYSVLCIADRVETFNQKTWRGPPILEMAKAGFFHLQNRGMDKVGCAFGCGKQFRFRSVDEDPWVFHKQISPNCPYLRALNDHGAKPSPLGRKRFCHSTDSLMAFNHQPA